MNQNRSYRTMLLGFSIILLSIAIIVKSTHYVVPNWLVNVGVLSPYIGFAVCVLGFFAAE
ncbi:MAG: hypothetical protein FWE11_10340 [Defluviitaleaceae bacterium]|nr:hypothetical protein [Defluviitaleaceae bacterium]